MILPLGIALLLIAEYIYERAAGWNEARRKPAPGRMVSVGNHKLHIPCTGSGAPTVVIEQGAGEPSRLWWPLQDQLV